MGGGEGVALKINLTAASVGPGWEEASSASSHGGDMFQHDKVFSEDGGDESPNPVDSIRLGVACGNTRLEVELMLKRQKDIQGEAFGECQNIVTPLGESFSNDLMGM